MKRGGLPEQIRQASLWFIRPSTERRNCGSGRQEYLKERRECLEGRRDCGSGRRGMPIETRELPDGRQPRVSKILHGAKRQSLAVSMLRHAPCRAAPCKMPELPRAECPKGSCPKSRPSFATESYGRSKFLIIFVQDRMRLGSGLSKSYGICHPLHSTFTIFTAE